MEGSVIFVFIGVFVVLVVLIFLYLEFLLMIVLVLVVVGSIVGALVEFYSFRFLDDNFIILFMVSAVVIFFIGIFF